MPLGSGLAAQLGFAPEVTYGVPVAPNSWLPLKGESLKETRARVESEGIVAGRRVLLESNRAPGNITVDGDVMVDLYNRGVGKLFTAMFGGVVTTGAGPFTHTFTPGDLSVASRALTLQMGVPTVAGAVTGFTYAGCKVASWSLTGSAGEIPELSLSVVGQAEWPTRTVSDAVTSGGSATLTSATANFGADDVGSPVSSSGITAGTTILSVQSTTSATLSANATGAGTALTIGVPVGTPTYPATIRPFICTNATVSLGGSAVNVKQFTINGDNGLNAERRFVSSARISEPLEGSSIRSYDGTLDLEFTDLTQLRRYRQASSVALVVTLTQGTDTATFTMNVQLDGTTPAMNGTDIVAQAVPFKALGTLAGSDATAITAVLVNADTVP